MAEMGESDIDKDLNLPDASEQMEEDTSNNEEAVREEVEEIDEGEFDFQDEETDEFGEQEDTEALAALSRQLDAIDTLLNVFEPKVDRVFAEAQELLKSSRETRLLLAQERIVTETENQPLQQ